MAKLSDLNLGNEKVGDVDFANMPDQRGGFTPLPQPGTFRFAFPKFDAGSPIFETLDSADGPRLNLVFEDAFALTIAQSAGNAHNGESFAWRVSNMAFNRSKKGDPEVKASDLDYLLRDVFGETARPKTNKDYAMAMIKHAGEEFTADLEYTWNCNPKRDIYVDDGEGGYSKVEGTKGCGAKYYQGGTNGVQKQPVDPNDPASALVWPERIACSGKDGVACGAVIRAFGRLRNFRK